MYIFLQSFLSIRLLLLFLLFILTKCLPRSWLILMSFHEIKKSANHFCILDSRGREKKTGWCTWYDLYRFGLWDLMFSMACSMFLCHLRSLLCRTKNFSQQNNGGALQCLGYNHRNVAWTDFVVKHTAHDINLNIEEECNSTFISD